MVETKFAEVAWYDMHAMPLRHSLNEVLPVNQWLSGCHFGGIILVLLALKWKSGNSRRDCWSPDIHRASNLLRCSVAHSWSVYLYAKSQQQIQTKQVLRPGITLSSCLALFGPKTCMWLSTYFSFYFIVCVRNDVCVCLLSNLIVWKVSLMHESLSLFWLSSQLVFAQNYRTLYCKETFIRLMQCIT